MVVSKEEASIFRTNQRPPKSIGGIEDCSAGRHRASMDLSLAERQRCPAPGTKDREDIDLYEANHLNGEPANVWFVLHGVYRAHEWGLGPP
jgi:hypothetical protein